MTNWDIVRGFLRCFVFVVFIFLLSEFSINLPSVKQALVLFQCLLMVILFFEKIAQYNDELNKFKKEKLITLQPKMLKTHHLAWKKMIK